MFRIFLFVLIFLSVYLCYGCHASPSTSDERIVALTPSLTSALLALAPQAPLVATSQYTTWPESARTVATLPMPTPLERLVQLRPTLVLAHPSDVQLISKLESLNIRVFAHAMDTLDDIYTTLETLSTLLDMPQNGSRAILQLKTELDQITARYATSPTIDILLIIDVADARMQHFYLAQNDAFLASLTQACGGHTLHTDNTNWGRISAESLFRLNPYAILFLSPNDAIGEERRQNFSTLYAGLDAISAGRVFYLNGESYSTPDLRLPSTQEAICKAIDTLRKR